MGLEVLKFIFSFTNPLATYLQGKEIDIGTAQKTALGTIATIKDHRNMENVLIIWNDVCKAFKSFQMCSEQGTSPSLHRQSKPSKRMQALCGESTEIANEPSNACFDIYYDAIDRVTTELTERFGNKNSNVLLSLSDVVLRDGTTKQSLKLISDFYSVDLDLLESECELFHNLTCNNKMKTVVECTKFLISNFQWFR